MVKAFRHPTSGAVVVCNAGAHTGVYRNPPIASVPPDWIANDPPGFRSPVPNKIGEVLFLHLGTAIPDGAAIHAEIGLGSHTLTSSAPGDFSGPLIDAGGTIPASWLGKQPVAKFTVISNGLSKTLYVPSGVTVEEEDVGEDPFPTALTSLDWTAEEIRNQAPAGRRRIRFLRAIPAAPGFQLVLYSSTGDPDTQPGTAAAVMTPPESYETVSQLTVGVTCVNRLWWRRINGGALDNPSNVVTFPILGLATTPPPGADPTFDPDATVSSKDAARAKAIEWISNWNGTVPAGKTANDHRIIGINATTSGLLDLRNLLVPHATARIYFRAVGAYTGTRATDVPSCSIKHNGPVSLDNSRGIHVALMDVLTGVSGGFTAANSQRCGAHYSMIRATAATNTPAGNVYNVYLDLPVDFSLTHCVIGGGNQSGLLFNNATGCHVIGNLFDRTSTDNIKVFWGFDNGRVERNWNCRRYLPKAATTPHYDFWQTQGQFHRNNRNYGNFVAQGDQEHVIQEFFHRYQALPSPQDYLYMDGTSWEQNIGFTGLGMVLGGAIAGHAGIAARYNTAIKAGTNKAFGCVINANAPRDFNYVAIVGGSGGLSNLAQPTPMAGPNGLPRSVGWTIRNPDKTTSWFHDYSTIAGDFRYGTPWVNANGSFKAEADLTIQAFEPALGSRLRWDHPNPVGAYLRAREIFDPAYRAQASAAAGYNVMPHKWPVLPLWEKVLNQNGYVATSYTGSWDSNGDPA